LTATATPSATPSSAPTSPGAPSAGTPVDIRTRVEDDRGMLKRLQLLIPGFRGYRQGEDLRAADSLLRLQVADRVHGAVTALQGCRQQLTEASQFQGLTDLAPALAELQELEGEIRHAEQGYTGISPAVRINPQQLETLYQYDYGFVSAADQVAATVAPLQDAAGASDSARIAQSIRTVRAQYRQLDTAFKARRRAVEGIQV
ncbi:MAG: hypothetical protein ACREDK_09060, partial [Thermoplasmata archaeon]